MSDLRELLERCMGRGGNRPTNEEIARAALLAEQRITELENALNAMLKAFEYDGQGEGENVACWDARAALKVHGYNKTVKEIAKGET